MNAGELIQSALRSNGILASGEVPTSAQYSEGLEALNQMLTSWSADGLGCNAVKQATLTCVAGTGSYVVTTSFTPTSRWTRAVSAFVRLDGTDYGLDIISRNQYNAIQIKTTQGQPSKLFYDQNYSTPTAYLYPVPGDAYGLYVDAEVPFANIASTSTTIALPRGWMRALKWNLAMEIAPEYGVDVTDIVARNASESKAAIERIDTLAKMSPINVCMPGIRETFSIYEG